MREFRVYTEAEVVLTVTNSLLALCYRPYVVPNELLTYAYVRVPVTS